MSAPEITRMTASDYFALPDSSRLEELIDGALIVSPTPVIKHQRLVLRLANAIERAMKAGEVFVAPTAVALDDTTVLEPDVFWVSGRSSSVFSERSLEGPPELAVEVLSPSSRSRDKIAKFRLYERFGVAEYWIADPDAALLEVFTLRDGAYALVGVYDAADTFHSPVLDAPVVLHPVFAALDS